MAKTMRKTNFKIQIFAVITLMSRFDVSFEIELPLVLVLVLVEKTIHFFLLWALAAHPPPPYYIFGCLLRSINELQVWAVSKKPSISRIFSSSYIIESAGKVARCDCDLNSVFYYLVEISIFLQGMMAVIYTY